MNKQELIKEYRDYGYSEAEISDMLDIEPLLVKDALIKDNYVHGEHRAKGIGGLYTRKSFKSYATDRDHPAHETLHKYGPLELNKMINRMGMLWTSKYIGVAYTYIIQLKKYFGAAHPLPGNALELTSYFPTNVRMDIDKRDNRECQRCMRPTTQDSIRYHKIAHPALCSISNCITLCTNCRSNRILKHIRNDNDLYQDMDYDSMRAWIHEHDPFHPRNRIYEKIWQVKKK